MKIAILGGGVIGLSCANVLSLQHDVTVIADRFGAETDSVKATAVWHVYLVPETDEVLSWAAETLEELSRIARGSPESGVELIKGIELFRNSDEHRPSWAEIPHVFCPLSADEVANLNVARPLELTSEESCALDRKPIRWGYRIEAPAADMTVYLGWLELGARQRGVSFRKHRITSLDEFADEYDAVINCTGIGAKELAHDNHFEPYKGQYFVFTRTPDAPSQYIGDDDHPGGMAYVIPRSNEVLVGGSAERGLDDDENTLDLHETIRRAGLYEPWVRALDKEDQARSPVIGVRPCRHKGIRLERESSGNRSIIHNYGHGGSGFSLSWGCAWSVSKLVDEMTEEGSESHS